MRRPWGTANDPDRQNHGRWSGRRPSHVVGIGLHGITDVEEEVKTLHGEMMTFGHELASQLFDDAHPGFDIPRPGVSQDKLHLYHDVWRPLMNEWLKFNEVHGDSFWQNLPLTGAWDRTQDFRQRYIDVRDRARKQQFALTSPEPLKPHRDPDFMAVMDKVGDAAKVAAVVVAGVLGIVVVNSFRGRSGG